MRASALLALMLLALPLLASAAPEPAGGTRVIVQFHRAPTPEERAALAAHGVGAFVEVIPAAIGDVTPAGLAWLRAQPWVERVDPDQALERHLDLSARLIRAGPPMLDLGYDGAGVTVAVLDSGIDASHPDFQGRVRANVIYAGGDWRPTQVDVDGHGTHVAGIVAGSGAASDGALQGVAPGAGLVAMDFSRAFTTSTALQAFDWVLRNAGAHGIRVVQNSWGRADEHEAWDPADSLVRGSNRLVAEGMVVLFSAGNRGPGANSLSLEAMNPNVITVGAVDDAGVLGAFSGRGPVLDLDGARLAWVKPDLVAPGVDILSTRSAQALGPIQQPSLVPSQLPGLGTGVAAEAARYTALTGTSQAAPHVAGIAAAMLQANPRLTPGQVHNLLRETAIDLGPEGPDDDTGFGLVDARDAVRRAAGQDEDRGNILLAGGEETYLARGTLSAAAGQLVQTSPVLQVKEAGAVEMAVPVKPGATSLRFDFAWTPASDSFRVYLLGTAKTLGPWTTSRPQGAERIVSGLVEDPEPGVYRLLARPSVPGQVEYRATAVVAVREQARLPAELLDQYRAPESLGPVQQLQDELAFEVAKLRRAVPGADGILAAVAVVALAVALRRRG